MSDQRRLLIEALAKAACPTRELDIWILRQQHPRKTRMTSENEGFAGVLDIDTNRFLMIEDFTKHVEVALRLLPKDWYVDHLGGGAPDCPTWWASVKKDGHPAVAAEAATPALALCAAILKIEA